jgi:hypothetical protein
VAEINEGMFKEFMDFVTAKQQAEAEDESGNEEVEVWDEKGRGARVKKKDALPFLQTLGIGVPEKPETTDDDGDTDKGKSKSRPTGKTAGSAVASGSSVKRYFSKPKP